MSGPAPGRRQVTAERFQAVLLDSDSTLVDSAAAVRRSWEAWARRFGVPAGRLGETHGMPSGQTIARLDRELDLGLDLELAGAVFDEIELGDLGDVEALPGAVDALGALGDRAAVVTSADRALASARLRAAGLPEPAVLVCADDVERGKPDPAPYREAAARLGVDPACCLVVEDSPAGLRSGRAAGAATLGLLTTTPRGQLGEADLVVPDLSWVRLGVDSEGAWLALRA
ncbi:HAD-IA family hydrolase [uncultured Serinicoccus sp.]|uniref:HAD-IA family hydrolase n=1 Tax=uncultured Serinicoccus sp. TaxID=735514 RepID=UPI00262EC691|nr:HAD-IA family hydrolase [uncultured Serinicoccus sp.]